MSKLSHFEYVGIILTFKEEIQRAAALEKLHRDNCQDKTQSEIYRTGQWTDAQQESAYQKGIKWALNEIRKLNHERL